MTISASRAVHLSLRTLTDQPLFDDIIGLDQLRKAAFSHPTHRAACLAAIFSDDTRFPAWSACEQVQRDWITAVRSIDPDRGPGQIGIDEAASFIRATFQPSELGDQEIRDLIRDRLYPDLISSSDISSSLFPASLMTQRPDLEPKPDRIVLDRPEGLGTAPAWLPLDPLEAERLHSALEKAADPVLSVVLSKLRACLSDVSSDEVFRAAAVEKYAGKLMDGDLDFQPDGMVSKGDEGAYVQAFLWVTNAEAGLDSPEESPIP